jgi:hypothetical protein
MTNRRNRWIGVGLGVVAAVVAVAAGATAIGAASTGTSHHLLSSDNVAQQLAELPTIAASPAPGTPIPGTAEPGGSQIFRSAGGMVVASCAGDTTTLLRWTPNSGYRADDNAVSPAHMLSVLFESDTADDVTVSVTCTNGVASATVSTQPDDHGGDRNGGTGGGGTDGPGHH